MDERFACALATEWNALVMLILRDDLMAGACNRSPKYALNGSSLPTAFGLGGYSGVAVGSSKYFLIVLRCSAAQLASRRLWAAFGVLTTPPGCGRYSSV